MNQPEILPCRCCGTAPKLSKVHPHLGCRNEACPLDGYLFTPENWTKINQPTPTWDFRETAKEPMVAPCLAWHVKGEWHTVYGGDPSAELYPLWHPFPPAPVVKGASKFEEFKAAVTERFGPQAAPPLEKLWNEACDALGKEGDKV